MENRPVSSGNTARRYLAVAVAAAAVLVLLLLTPLPAEAQTPRASSRAGRQRDRNAERLRAGRAPKLSLTRQRGIRSDHRPPITFDEGSLVIGALKIGDEPKMMTCVTDAAANPARPYVCTRNPDSPAMVPPKRLSIAITKNDGRVGYHNRHLQTHDWEIRIWMEIEVEDGVFEPAPVNAGAPPDAPHILLRGPYIIESDKQLGPCTATGVPERPCKYEHPGYDGADTPVRHFRIARIDYVREGDLYFLELKPNRLRVSGNLIPEPHSLRGRPRARRRGRRT